MVDLHRHLGILQDIIQVLLSDSSTIRPSFSPAYALLECRTQSPHTSLFIATKPGGDGRRSLPDLPALAEPHRGGCWIGRLRLSRPETCCTGLANPLLLSTRRVLTRLPLNHVINPEQFAQPGKRLFEVLVSCVPISIRPERIDQS